MVQNKSFTAIGMPGNFRSKFGLSSNFLAFWSAFEKSSVIYALSFFDFSDLSTKDLVTSYEESFFSLYFELVNLKFV